MIDHIKKSSQEVKIIISLPKSDWHNYGTESLWSKKLSEAEYQIDSVPFCAYGLSYMDIVTVEKSKGGELLFKEIKNHCGHSTYRFFLNKGVQEKTFTDYWKSLEKLGCTYEKGYGSLYAIDVPPDSDIQKVYQVLEEGEKREIWGFEEAHFGHEVRKN